MNRPYGTRPRSLDLVVPDGVSVEEIVAVLKDTPACRSFFGDVQALFQIAKNVFSITFAPRKTADDISVRKDFLWATRDGINTEKGRITFTLPTPPAKRITIRGIPTEIENEEVKQELEKLGCGFICRMSRLLIKGTKIMNGYRDIWIKDYVPHKLPERIRFDHVDCKVFLPPEEMKQTCEKCLEDGHPTPLCSNPIVCWYCKVAGHKRYDCTKRKKDFPPLGKRADECKKIATPDKIIEDNNWENKLNQEKKGQTNKRSFNQVSSDSSLEIERDDLSKDSKKAPFAHLFSETSDDEDITGIKDISNEVVKTIVKKVEGQEGCIIRDVKHTPPENAYRMVQATCRWEPRNQKELEWDKGDCIYLLKEEQNTEKFVMGILVTDWDKGLDKKGLVLNPEFLNKHPDITLETLDDF